MISELIPVVAGFLLLEFIGLGPALMLLSTQPKKLTYALLVAPGLGIALVLLLGLPLVRYVSPVQAWAVALTVFLLVVSAGLCVLSHRRDMVRWRMPSIKASGIFLAVFAAVVVILTSPLLVHGIQYAIYRSNSSDAFTYISLAETTRRVPWDVLVHGMDFSPANTAGLTALAQAAPTALFTARNVGFPLQLNDMVTLAWLSGVVGQPVYGVYYAYHLLAYLIAFALGVALGDMLGLGRVIKYLAAASIAVGFWARFVLETDASYEIVAMPMLLLVVLAWMQQEEYAPQLLFSRERLLVILAAAALACTYLILAPFVAVAFAVYYLVQLVLRERTIRDVLAQLLTGVGVLGLFAATGQIDLIFLNLLYNTSNVDRQKAFEPTVWNLWRANGLNAIWGMPLNTIVPSSRRLVRLPIAVLSNAYGILTTALLVLAGWTAFFRPQRPAGKIIFSVLIAAGLFMIGVLLSGNLRAVGKAFTYVFPYAVLGLAGVTVKLDFAGKRVRQVAVAAVALWCVVQIGLGVYLPFSNTFARVFQYTPRTEQYDLSAITRVLDANPPRQLLVSIPRESGWEFAYYSAFVFGTRPTYFQSGLIVDNNVTYQNVWLEPLTTPPDYAVISKKHDYIGPAHWGDLLAETRDLALYRVLMTDVTRWNEKEQELQRSEGEKPKFEATLPMLFQAR